MRFTPRNISLFFLLLLMTACTKQTDLLLLEKKLSSQEQQLQMLQKKQGQTTREIERVSPGQADLWSEVQGMRVQLAQLQGQVEDMQNQLELQEQNTPALQAEVTRLDESTRLLDAGLRQVASAMDVQLEFTLPKQKDAEPLQISSTSPATAPNDLETATKVVPQKQQVATPDIPSEQKTETPPTQSSATKDTEPEESGTPATTPATPPATPDPSTLKPEAIPEQTAATTQKDDIPQDSPAQPALPPSEKTVEPAEDIAKTLYNAAFVAFKERRYTDAQRMWEQFEKAYPKHALLPNSIFWQGEAYYQSQNYANAVLAYQRVIAKHKKSSKYLSALLKQGASFLRLGKKKTGRYVLTQLIKKHPKTAEAKRAEKILKKYQSN